MLNQRLEEIGTSGEQNHLTIAIAWDLLRSVPVGEPNIVNPAVVFDPNKMLMHVAFSENGQHSPFCRVVTLNVKEMIE